MADLYASLAATALALLAKFGTTMKLNKRTPGVYAAGKVTQGTVQYDITAAQFDLTQEQLANSATLVRPRRLLIAASGLPVTIDNEDTITYGTDTFKVKNPGPIAPAGTVVVYDAVVEA